MITYVQMSRTGHYPTHLAPIYGGGVAAYDGRNLAGFLKWYPADHRYYPNEIAQVTVYSDYRRRGIATRLFREAQKLYPDIRHSKLRTNDGDAWAKSTGDPVPIRGWRDEQPFNPYRLQSVHRIFEDIRWKILNETEEVVYERVPAEPVAARTEARIEAQADHQLLLRLQR